MAAELRWSNRVAIANEWRTWSELAELGASYLPSDLDVPIAVVTEDVEEGWPALAHAMAVGLDFALIGSDRLDPDLVDLLSASGYRVVGRASVIAEPRRERKATSGEITVLTSGTTGRPQLVPHGQHTLATIASGTRMTPRRWLQPYAPGTYAWYQCAFLGLTVPDQDVASVPPADVEIWVSRGRDLRVDAVTASPTFWRRSFLHHAAEELASVPLRQITLGGEPVEQNLLNRLHDLYPSARLTHIYASTEAGACIVVSDGRAGFPVTWLNDSTRRVRLRIRADRLEVMSPWAGTDRQGRWLDTGDRTRITDDRVEIVGRSSPTVVNVGGTKVATEQIAAVLADHPEVLWCRVRPQRAPIVGELPVADVVCSPSAAVDETTLITWCRGRLPEIATPRRVYFHDDIPLTDVAKAVVFDERAS